MQRVRRLTVRYRRVGLGLVAALGLMIMVSALMRAAALRVAAHTRRDEMMALIQPLVERRTLPDSIPSLVAARGAAQSIVNDADATAIDRRTAGLVLNAISIAAETRAEAGRGQLRHATAIATPRSLEEVRPRQDAMLFTGLRRLNEAELLGAAVDIAAEIATISPRITVHAPRAYSDARATIAPLNICTGEPEPVIVQTSVLPLSSFVIGAGYYRISVYSSTDTLLAEYDRNLVDPIDYVIDSTDLNGTIDANMILISRGHYPVGRRQPPSVDPLSPYQSRTVSVRSFYIDKYEVSASDYLRFCGGDTSLMPTRWQERGIPIDEAELRRPVYGVSWMAATRYAEWRGCRLPTWIEWQIAGRGPSGNRFPWGSGARELSKATAIFTARDKPDPRGSHPDDCSWCGAYDLLGNVAEWTGTPYVSIADGSLFSHFGWRIVGGLDWRDRLDSSEATEQLDLGCVFQGAPGSDRFGFRCARSADK